MKTLTMLAAVSLTVLAVRADKKPADKDEDRIRGTWKMVSGDKGGEKAPEDLVKRFRLTLKADGKLTVVAKEDGDQEGTYKLDTGKKPKQIDITVDDKMMEGIYELDGDNLKLCVAEAGSRPTEFKAPEGSKVMLIVLKREKKQ